MSSPLPPRTPCTYCPWRVGVDAWAIGRDHSPDIPPLHHSQMVSLAERQGRGLSSTVMACHLTHRGEEAIHPHERTCVGYALSEEGGDNLNLRMLAVQGRVDLRAYSCTDPRHPNFMSMLLANPARGGEKGKS